MTCVQGHSGLVLGNRVDNQGLWEEGFVVSRRRGDALFLQEDVIGSFE